MKLLINRDTSISALVNFMHVTLFCFLFLFFFFFVFFFSYRELLQLILESPLLHKRNLLHVGRVLSLDKTLKEWYCVAFHAKKHYGQCLCFAVVSL